MGDALTGSLQKQWQMEQQQREQIGVQLAVDVLTGKESGLDRRFRVPRTEVVPGEVDALRRAHQQRLELVASGEAVGEAQTEFLDALFHHEGTEAGEVNSARLEKGTLLASGFIAGGALMGVVSAALRFGGINLMNEEWASSNAAEILAVVMYLVMIAYLTFNSLNAKKE